MWGSGSDGQLGLGDKVLFLNTPKRIKDSTLQKKVTYIATGECYSAAITGLFPYQLDEYLDILMHISNVHR